MELEFITVADEEVPIIILDCAVCGERISIPERDVKTSKPVVCPICCHVRYLSYREYITITDRFAAVLLEHTVAKFGGPRPRTLFKSCN